MTWLGGARDASRFSALAFSGLLVIGCSSELPASENEAESTPPAIAKDRSPVSETTDERVWGLAQKLVASDPASGDLFGIALAMSGDTAVVGTSATTDDRGAAYVFVRSGARWAEQQKLTESGATPTRYFGSAVAIDGDTLVVGASLSAYVFVRSGTTWAEQQKLTASSGDISDNFGRALAVDGDTLLIGASDAVVDSVRKGAAYVFIRNGSTWSERQIITASDGEQRDYFGHTVALDGDDALVGAPGDDESMGSIYAFTRAGTNFSGEQRFDALDRAVGFGFGAAMDLDDDRLAVGNFAGGSVFLAEKVDSSWVVPTEIAPVFSMASSAFGTSVALFGRTFFAGGPQSDADRGAVYPFEGEAQMWFEQPRLVAPDASPYARFGGHLTVEQDTLLVGAEGDSNYAGAAYVYRFALPLGSSCTLAAECLSGECNEGICCAERCESGCFSCLASRKTNGPDGECGPVRAGTDPLDACDAEDESTCGRTGSCDGGGGCALHPVGTECAVTSCASPTREDPRDVCDGTGTCEASAERDCADGYACLSDACRPTCASDVDCDIASGYACRNGECKRADDGDPCSAAQECESGHCVDGVCCNRACDGQCEACAEESDPGNCIPVTGVPRGDREACGASPAGELCLTTVCDGESRTACAGFMGSNVVCAPAACSNGEATPEARCDGDGNCPEVEPIACGAYRCGATACKSSCASDSDCAAGSACDVNDRCVSGSTCSDDGTTLIDSLGNERSCAPYRCASGQCGDTCESSSDCVSGFACNPSNRECEEVSKPVAEDGGCGCRVGAKSRASAWLAWLAVLGLVGFRRARHSHRLLRRTHD